MNICKKALKSNLEKGFKVEFKNLPGISNENNLTQAKMVKLEDLNSAFQSENNVSNNVQQHLPQQKPKFVPRAPLTEERKKNVSLQKSHNLKMYIMV